MADIFQQELDSPEGQESSDENNIPTEPEVETETERTSDENDNKNNELDVELEIDNLYYFQSQTLPTLEELASSDYIHNRQLAAKKILESLQRAGSNQEELQSIISVMCKLSEDDENIVISELVQHIPSIALFCQSHPSGLKLVIQQQLVPYTVKLLNDRQIGVRKLAQSALLVLLENNLIGHLQLSEWICPLISQLAMCESNLEEQRIEDVTVMSMMIPLVDKEMVIKYFLEPYISLCCDLAFGIRTVCAMRFGTLCKIAGTETTELSLLPSFLNLCSDDLWGVRKACADVFVDVATVVSLKIRKEVLPHIFINLLNDTSRYVKFAAYQSLGGFICSFADPNKTGCIYEEGKLNMTEDANLKDAKDDLHMELNGEYSSSIEERRFFRSCLLSKKVKKASSSKLFKSLIKQTPSIKQMHKCEDLRNFEYIVSGGTFVLVSSEKPTSQSVSHPSLAAKDERVFLHIDNDNVFNHFQYWRTPLPEVELDIDIDGGKATNIHVRAKVPGKDEAAGIKVNIASNEMSDSPTNGSRESVTSHLQVQPACFGTFPASKEKNEELDEASESHIATAVFDSGASEEEASVPLLMTPYEQVGASEPPPMTPYDQDIVPTEILFRFLSVINQAYPADYDRIGYCAFSFPAVAFTLGRKYWPCIREACKKLACVMKWTVRSTIASSLHELATILGHDITVEDLLPIFLEFLKDVDEVRLKLVNHLPDFLKHLRPHERWEFLPFIAEFSQLDNERNWRFRCAVAEQLRETLDLYNPFDIYEYFLPIALSLLQDKVSTVRYAAVEYMAVIIKHLFRDEKTEIHCRTLLSTLDSTYRQAYKWNCRQTYVLLCEQLAKNRSLSADTFVEEIVPRLFSLAWDVVPNVRLAVSRCLALTLLPNDYLPSIQKARYELLLQVMYSLQGDVDEDVRHFARLSARAFSVLPEKKLSPV